MNKNVVMAVFRRNFVSYFSNPTGYAFICLFVVLGSLAAFWPNEFFVANLANLDQLNKYLPWILLVFIPAITMSIWADERRQGTDELLLTIPATDTDVVLGKFAAAVGIYTVSLLFSLICNFLVLYWLGNPDVGLFIATYIGYWLVGVAMLSIGMVASFLTGNLTVGFLLGALFNLPLVSLYSADTIFSAEWAATAAHWSVAEQFRDFGHGVIALASVCYFASITVTMVYLSIILISRRHWSGNTSSSMGSHYFVRTVSMIVLAVGIVMLADRSGLRGDMSDGKISSLSPQSYKLLADMDAKRPVLIEAFVSPQVPTAYVETRLNLLSALREFQAMAPSKIELQIRSTEVNSDEAQRAEKLYGIRPRRVQVREGGAYQEGEIFLAAAFVSGASKPVVVPFFDTGIPVEYELARSIVTAGRGERKKIGFVRTDAQLFAGFDQATFSPTPNSPLIEELQKQYDVEQVSPEDLSAKGNSFQALVAVQPSTLAPQQLEMFIAAVRQGIPTAVFEDPAPMSMNVTATSQPKRPQGQMAMFGGGAPQPKGDIGRLWSYLGIDLIADRVVSQDYNPHKRLQFLPPEVVFIDEASSDQRSVFNERDPITSGLQELVFIFPGMLSAQKTGPLKYDQLVMTGDRTGYVGYNDLIQMSPFGGGGLNPRPRRRPTPGTYYCLALHVTGTPLAEPARQVEPGKSAPEPEKPAPLNVVVVADVDLFNSDIFGLRAMANNQSRSEIDFQFDNVPFVLNIIDVLAGDESLVEIRKRRPQHRPLERVEQVTKSVRDQTQRDVEHFLEEREKATNEAQRKMQEAVDKLNQRLKDADPSKITEELQKTQMATEKFKRETDATVAKLASDFEKKKAEADRRLDHEVRAVQKYYKVMALILPPLFPLLAGLAVFINRRAREREGVSRRRLR